jgi:hypothetical protein
MNNKKKKLILLKIRIQIWILIKMRLVKAEYLLDWIPWIAYKARRAESRFLDKIKILRVHNHYLGLELHLDKILFLKRKTLKDSKIKCFLKLQIFLDKICKDKIKVYLDKAKMLSAKVLLHSDKILHLINLNHLDSVCLVSKCKPLSSKLFKVLTQIIL